ncbi:glycoside hydrolase family 88 protein [Butyricicoccus porcorum]|uniref:glycoside hydrolase family 88 protein n=1 Tax=Butyricicoccus porcorum TaxID=1945634 RepID=UPI003F4AEA7F
MTFIFFILVSIISFCALVLWGVDFYYFIINRYCRFHIGRWESTQEWQRAVIKRAIKWTKKTPTVKITDNSRYLLLDMIQGKYRSQTIQSWQNASLILGLMTLAPHEARESAKKYLNAEGNWRKKPVAVDAGMLAYAVLKVADEPEYEYVKPAMDEITNIIKRNTDKNGLISYCGGIQNPERYVDTLGLTCPFLALYARVYDCPEYAKLAFRQLEFYHDFGLYKDTALPNHAIDCESKLPLGVYGWGRGTVWYALGLIDTYQELPDGKDKKTLKQWISEAANSYLRFQKEDGGFGSSLHRISTYDSSATAGMAYFFRSCAHVLKNDEYQLYADLCLECLKRVTRITGSIDWCQGDTKGIGIFAQTYDVMPFAQGLAIRAFK